MIDCSTYVVHSFNIWEVEKKDANPKSRKNLISWQKKFWWLNLIYVQYAGLVQQRSQTSTRDE
jgi:hypothetical protein